MHKRLIGGIATALLPLVSHSIAGTGSYGYTRQAAAKQQRLSTHYTPWQPKQEPISRSYLESANIKVTSQSLELQSGQTARELVIIDSAIPDKHVIYQNNAPGVDVVEIDSSKDGLSQLKKILAQYHQLDAMHLFSHATDGVIQLGNRAIDADLLKKEVNTLASIDSAMKEGADVYFYGCNLAETEQGEQLLELISHQANVDVAASSDTTGHQSLGGDWDLEISTGDINTQVRYDSIAMNQFEMVLPWSGTLSLDDVGKDFYTNSGGEYYFSEYNYTVPTTSYVMYVSSNAGTYDHFTNYWGSNNGLDAAVYAGINAETTKNYIEFTNGEIFDLANLTLYHGNVSGVPDPRTFRVSSDKGGVVTIDVPKAGSATGSFTGAQWTDITKFTIEYDNGDEFQHHMISNVVINNLRPAPVLSPGGVIDGLALWLKADAGLYKGETYAENTVGILTSTGVQVVGQSFTATDAGTIRQINFNRGSAHSLTQATLEIFAGDTISGTPIHTQTVSDTTGAGVSSFVLSTAVAVTSGSQYTVLITPTSGSAGFQFDNGGNPYAGGQRYFNGSAQPATDFNFSIEGDDVSALDTDEVFLWKDQSGATVDGISSSANAPVVDEDYLNFNPSILFDGTTSFLTKETDLGDSFSYFIVLDEDTAGNISLGHGLNDLNHQSGGTGLYGNSTFHSFPDGAVQNTPLLRGATADKNGASTIYENGERKSVTAANVGEADQKYGIGSSNTQTNYLEGHIAEVIVYDANIDAGTQAQQIQSYLALKYGITLDQTTATDYLASDGTTKMWGSAVNAAYNNDIFGIGRDDAQLLDQKISKSMNPTGIMTVSTNNDFTSANIDASRVAHPADLNFHTFSDNGGAATWTTTGAPAGYQLLSKQWLAQEEGTYGAINVQFDVADADFDVPALDAGTSYYIVIDTDDDGLLSDETPTALTANGDLWAGAVDFADGAIFSLATEALAPALSSFTSSTVDGTYSVGSEVGICANYDLDLQSPSTMTVTLDTGATVTLSGPTSGSIGGNVTFDPLFVHPNFASTVQVMEVQGDDKVIVGGNFNDFDSIGTMDKVTRLNADGTRDTGFALDAAFSHQVQDLAIQADGKVIVAGEFVDYDGIANLDYLARLNANGTRDTGFTLGAVFDNDIYTVAMQADGKVLVGGRFLDYNGVTTADRFIRLNADGSYDAAFAPTAVSSNVYSIEVQDDGKILIGGAFINYDGVATLDNLARLNADGTRDTSFTPPNPGGVVRDITIQSDGKILVGGQFTDYDGQANLDRLMRLNTDGTRDTGFALDSGFSNTVFDASVQTDGKILLAGAFAIYDGVTELDNIARLNADGSRDTTFNLTVAPSAGALAITSQSDGTIIFGGSHVNYDGQANLDRLTALTGDVNISGSNANQICGTYSVAAGQFSTDLNVTTIDAANVNSVNGGNSADTTIPAGQNLADNAALVVGDVTPPVTPSCSTTPSPAADGTAVTMSCTGVEVGATVTTPGMTCTPSPATSATVSCTGTVASGGLNTSNDIVTVTDAAGNANTSETTGLTIDNGTPATPVCSTTPSPANDGTSVTTSCTGVETGTTVTIPNMTCTPSPVTGTTVSCTGTVGTGAGQISTQDDTVTVSDPAGNTNTSETTGLVIDNTAPAGPGSLTGPGSNTSDTDEDIVGSCGADAANGSVKVTTTLANGFSVMYDTVINLDATGGFTIVDPNWSEGSYTISLACTDDAGNGPTDLGPFGPSVIDSTDPATPVCSTSPSPAADGTSVTTSCTGIEIGTTVSIPNMTCTPSPATGTTVSCTGTVGTGAGQISTQDDTVTVTDPSGNTNTSETTGLVIDNTPPAGPGTVSGPGTNTNDTDEDIVGSCGADAANGTVKVTTTPANGFSVQYDTEITLNATGGFTITDPNWSEGTYTLSLACKDDANNGPTDLGPFGPTTIDTSGPGTPVCTTTPSPANDGTSVTMSCTGVEVGATVTTPGMTCTPSPATSTTVSCTGTVGTGGLTTSNATVTVVDPAGNTNTSETTGLVIDNTPPAGPGTVSGPGTNTNDSDEDIVGSCGVDAANGTVKVTTTPANGFSVMYDTAITLDATGGFTITDPNWSEGTYTLSLACKDDANNGPTDLGPFGPTTVDTTDPADPFCSTTPTPSQDGTAVTMTCTGVEVGTRVTTPGMICTPSPATSTTVSCTGTVGSNGLTTSNATVTVVDPAGNSNTSETTGLTIDNTPSITPGGVGGGLALWLRANEQASNTGDGTPLTAWIDQSGNGDDLASTVGSPTYFGTTNLMNFNAAIGFDGDDRILTTNSGIIGSNNEYTKFAATRLNTTGDVVILSSDNNNNVTHHMFSFGGDTAMNHNTFTFIRDNGNMVVGGSYLNTNRYGAGGAISSVSMTDGLVSASSGFTNPRTGTRSFTDAAVTSIGGRPDGGNYDGEIAETIIYNVALSDSDLKKVHSYLALKYGISLDQSGAAVDDGDYLDSSGAVVWDESVNGAYNNDIFGITKDDLAMLDQRISKSQNADAIVTVSSDTNFVTANTTHADILANGESFVIANNDTANNAAATQTSELPGTHGLVITGIGASGGNTGGTTLDASTGFDFSWTATSAGAFDRVVAQFSTTGAVEVTLVATNTTTSQTASSSTSFGAVALIRHDLDLPTEIAFSTGDVITFDISIDVPANLTWRNSNPVPPLADFDWKSGVNAINSAGVNLELSNPDAYGTKLVREWRVDAVGNVGPVNLKFDNYDENWELAIDTNNGNFTDAYIVGALDANGEITGVNFVDGDYFTLVQPLDSDGDGVFDRTDLDDDNDGILDTVEGGFSDLQNGDFSDSPGAGVISSGNDNLVAFWEVENGNIDLIGTNGIDLLGNIPNTIISQTVATTSGASYTLAFDYGINTFNGNTSATFAAEAFEADGTTNIISTQFTSTQAAKVSDSITFTAVGNTTVIKLRQVLPTSGVSGNTIDNITLISGDVDNDTIPNRLDLDSDGDGIPDAVEARATAGYVSATFVNNASNNGVNDNGTFTPINSDSGYIASDTLPDFLDDDSDGDGTSDDAEDTSAAANPTYADPDGSKNTPLSDLTNTDNDTADADYRSLVAGYTVVGTPSMNEGGTATFTVVLDNQTPANVVLTLSSADTGAVTVSPSPLTFTPANWNATQTVTVTGVVDPDATDESVAISVFADASSYDSYEALATQTVTASVTDNSDIIPPATPVCSTSPIPANDGTVVTTSCSGVETGATVSIPNMSCTPSPATGTTVSCTGTVGTGAGQISTEDDTVTVSDPAGNTNTSETTGLVIDNTPPAGPGTVSGPGTNTNDTDEDIVGSCGADAANGTVKVTTTPANGFSVQYDTNITLNATGGFTIVDPNWSEGSYTISLACTDDAGNGPTDLGPFGPSVIDSTDPATPVCSTSPSPAADGTSVTMSCTGVEVGATVTTPGMTCTPSPATGTTVSCTGTVGTGGLTTSNATVTVVDPAGNTNTGETTGLVIDNTPPAGPGTVSGPGTNTNDTDEDIVGSCGADAANGTVKVTTTPANGFSVQYDTEITLNATGGFTITDPNWSEGTYTLSLACKDDANNGPTDLGPFGPTTIDTSGPGTPVCTTTPSPANDGTSVTMSCTGVEVGATVTTPGMTCTPSPATSTTVSCTGTVGTGGLTTSNATVTVVDPAGNTNTSETTGLVIDNTPPAGPGTVSGPGTNTNDSDEDIVGSCGVDAANGTVKVTTTPANGFSVMYDTAITLDATGGFTITDPNWSEGTYTLSLACKDDANNGPTDLGPFGPTTVDTTDPADPFCSTTPTPSQDGTAVTMTCTGVEVGTRVTTPGMICTPSPATSTTVSCTGTVGSNGLTTSNDTVTVTDPSGNTNTNATSGLVIDNGDPTGPGSLTAPGSTNDIYEDIVGSCGTDSANGTVKVTTNPVNGFTANYDTAITLDGNGDFTIINPGWTEGSYTLSFACTDEAGNGPVTFGPFGPSIIDITNPATPSCSTTPSPAQTGTAVTMLCTGVETAATVTTPGMTCGAEANGSVTCTGTIGTSGLTTSNDTVTVTDSVNNSNTSGTTGLVIDDTAPAGPGSLTGPGSTNDLNEDIVGSCGTDSANGSVQVTTTPANGFTTQYNIAIPLDANGDFSIVNPNWSEGQYSLSFACTDEAGNGPTDLGPFTGVIIDVTAPATPVCSTTPSPANDNTAVSMTCTGVETGATLTTPGMTCGAEASGTVTCTGTVSVAGLVTSNATVTVVDTLGNPNTSGTTGLVIDNTPPTGPGDVSAPGITNDIDEDIVASCGTDSANGTVKVTTAPANGFTNMYDTVITLDANGDFTIVDPNWSEGEYSINLSCTDEAGNGPSSLGPYPGVIIDTTVPATPVCSTTPTPANDGTVVTMTCSGVEENTTLTTVGMTCVPTPADATEVVTCTGTVGSNGLNVSDATVTVTDGAGNENTTETTGLEIDNTDPTGIGSVLSSPTPNTNDIDEDIVGSCGVDAANGTVKVTTLPVNGFTTMYDTVINLDANGDFTIVDPNWSEGTYTVDYACTDEAGNGPSSVGPFGPIMVDTTDPAEPTCTTVPVPANPGDTITTTCTGVEVGATLTIPNMVCTPAITGPSGEVTCTAVIGTGPGEVSVPNDTVTVTDPAGNTNTSAMTGLTLDVTPPTAPTINPVDETSTEVTGTAEPGGTVDLSPLTCDNAPVIADAAGVWRCDVTNSAPLTVGLEIIATVTDATGNQSPPSSTTVSETGGQATPTIDPTDGSILTGTGEVGDTITVTDASGNTVCTTVVAADGSWSCSPATPIPAGAVIDATATDPTTGNVSGPATTTVSGPAQLLPPTVDPTNGTEVTGSTVPNGIVEIIDPVTGTVLCTTTADTQGNFTCAPLSPVPNSGTPINVLVTNNAVTSAPATTIVDGLPPTAPSINPYTEGEPTITGIAEPGNEVSLAPIVCANAPVIADSLGLWSCTPTVPPIAGETIMATAIDPAGNTSGQSQMPVTGTGGLVPPTVYPTNGNTVSGIGIPGNTVTVVDPNGVTLCTALVDSNGQWSCNPAPMPSIGETINVSQTDPSGNTSAPVPVTILDPSQTTSPPPSIEPTDGTVINGGGIPLDTIIVRDESGAVLCSATVELNGTWSCTPPSPLSVGSVLFAIAIDPSTGSSSGPAQATVVSFFEPIGVRTGLDGGVGGAINGLFVLLLGMLIGLRRRYRLLQSALLVSLCLSLPVMAEERDQAGAFYVGANGGMSFVEPDPGASDYVLDEDTSDGFKLTLGYHFTDYLAVEGLWTDMGEATLLGDGSSQFPDGAIDYSFGGVGVRFTLPVADRFAVSTMVGVGQIDNTGNNIAYEQVEDTQVFVGLGAEYRLGERFSVVGQYDYFDTDAQLATVGVRYRFGGKRAPKVKDPAIGPPITAVEPEPTPEPIVTAAIPEPIVTAAIPEPISAPVQMVAACQDEVNAILLNNNIYFDSSSADIAARSMAVVSQIKNAVMRCSSARILIDGHTDSQGGEAANQRLSEARAKAVAKYLVDSGVSATRIGVRGFGESQPIADNNTAEGRAANRRIEMRLSQ